MRACNAAGDATHALHLANCGVQEGMMLFWDPRLCAIMGLGVGVRVCRSEGPIMFFFPSSFSGHLGFR